MRPIAEAVAEIQQIMRRSKLGPVGTISFRLLKSPIFSENNTNWILLEAANLSQVFRIDRTPDLKLRYHHWSPGIGSRLATVDLKECPASPDVDIQFTWHPDRTQLLLVPLGVLRARPVSADGVSTQRSFRAGRDGNIYQIGDDGLEMMGTRISIENESVLLPTALEIWKETIAAANVLSSGKSDQGYMFDVAVSNAVLGGLVTGFESYCKYRFIELYGEGVTFNVDGLVVAFKKSDRDEFVSEFNAADEGARYEMLYRALEPERRVNFQNFKIAKRAFRLSYDLDFADLGLTAAQLDVFSRRFDFRHRSVHVSPLVSVYSRSGEPGHPVLASRDLTVSNIALFDDFISKLHQATIASMRKMERAADDNANKTNISDLNPSIWAKATSVFMALLCRIARLFGI